MEDANYGTSVVLEDHCGGDNLEVSQFMAIDANDQFPGGCAYQILQGHHWLSCQ